MGEPLIAATELTYSYRNRSVLKGVDVELHAGEIVALLGPNGAGKTTLMKVLVGLLEPARGTVQGPPAHVIGWVPQGGAVYQRLTVHENLRLFARLMRLAGDADDLAASAVDEALLAPWRDTLASELSGGLRQRLNVAVGLLGGPELLVLDEPTTGVDLEHRAALFGVLRDRADEGCAVLCSTHSLEDAAGADRAIVMVDGRIAYSGTVAGIADAAPEAHVESARSVHDAISLGLLRLWACTPQSVQN
ncbi:MAG: transporter ATP-binding protein [Thermoleophilia bacterium]|nr:transporter ATP-binding protein [Thermoleophilia bacterium]